MKKLMFLSLLIVVGLSFAQGPPPAGPAFNTFAQTCCMGQVAEYQVMAVYMEGYAALNGQICTQPTMPYDSETIDSEICDDGDGVWAYYMDMVETCFEQGQGTECLNAYRQFYSRAASAKGMFSATKTAYLSFARQSMYAYMNRLCPTASPQTVNFNIAYASNMYRECMQDPWDCINDCGGAVEE